MTDNVDIEGKNKIALLIDGVVQQIFYSTQSDAALLLSQPTFYEIPAEQEVLTGYTFDGTVFAAPVVQPE